ncbi:galactose-specific lectin nattectin-like [Gigantopelta aegis]|uniref:galactose-specific lectin nattectin-like n=1 Tax=Gigantopelta aegis TaxID=1735272 RepID=UPI001B887D5C|nr:galactose-specific lectin nattectin-like [Gigantopelta aegis]
MATLLTGMFSLVIKGYSLTDGPPGFSVWSVTACADRCLADKSCYAFFHNKKSGLCLLHNSKHVTNRELTPTTDMRFYVINKDYCPTEKGYSYSSDPPLCYRLGLQKLNHNAAMAACQNDGGFLVRIDSQKKHDYVAQLPQVMSASSQPWIDGGDDDIENEWRFTDGTLMTYTHWEYTQPNHDGDCVRLRLYNYKVEWWDTQCSLNHLFICEIPTG